MMGLALGELNASVMCPLCRLAAAAMSVIAAVCMTTVFLCVTPTQHVHRPLCSAALSCQSMHAAVAAAALVECACAALRLFAAVVGQLPVPACMSMRPAIAATHRDGCSCACR